MRNWRETHGRAAILATMLFGATAPAISGQSAPGPDTIPDLPSDLRGPYHLALGLGAGSFMGSGAQGGVAFRGAVTFPRGGGLVTVRFAGMEEFALFKDPSEAVWDLGILYGRGLRSRWAYASASAGLGLAGGMRRGERIPPDPSTLCTGSPLCLPSGLFSTTEYEEDPFLTVGIPLELEVGWTFSSRVGLGLSLFADVNPERNAVGSTLSLMLGRLR